MNTLQRKEIASLIEAKCKNADTKIMSQGKFAAQAGISPGHLSTILSGDWDKVSDDMWRKLGRVAGYDFSGYQIAPIENIEAMFDFLSDAQESSMSICIADDRGKGKTEGAKQYCKEKKNAYLLECDEYWSVRLFYENLCQSIGLIHDGMTSTRMAEAAILHLKKQEKAILILDEFDKLSRPQQMFYITLYNKLDGICSIVICGQPAMENMIQNKRNRRAIGYEEIYSRFGSNYLKLENITRKDVEAICKANGIEEQIMISKIFNDCQLDLRRVKRSIQTELKARALESSEKG